MQACSGASHIPGFEVLGPLKSKGGFAGKLVAVLVKKVDLDVLFVWREHVANGMEVSVLEEDVLAAAEYGACWAGLSSTSRYYCVDEGREDHREGEEVEERHGVECASSKVS